MAVKSLSTHFLHLNDKFALMPVHLGHWAAAFFEIHAYLWLKRLFPFFFVPHPPLLNKQC